MTKQEEIREGIKAILEAGDIFLNPPEDLAEFISKPAIKQSRVDQILTYLGSQGVVIKVGDIQETITTASESRSFFAPYKNGALMSSERTSDIFKDFKEAGYVAVEPLTKEANEHKAD